MLESNAPAPLSSKSPTSLQIEVLKGIETEIIYNNCNDHAIPSHPFTCVLSRMSGWGRPNLLISLLMKPEMYYGFFKHILIVSPNIESDKSYKHVIRDEFKTIEGHQM